MNWLIRAMGLNEVVMKGGQGLTNLYQSSIKHWFVNNKRTSFCKRTAPMNNTTGRNRRHNGLPVILNEMTDEVKAGVEPENTAHVTR